MAAVDAKRCAERRLGAAIRIQVAGLTGEASLQFAIPPRARGVAEEIIAELTSGSAELRVIGERWVDSEVRS